MFMSISEEENYKLLKKRTKFSFSEFMDIIHIELYDLRIKEPRLQDLFKIKKKTDLLLYKNNEYVKELYQCLINDNIYILLDKENGHHELCISSSLIPYIKLKINVKKLKIDF